MATNISQDPVSTVLNGDHRGPAVVLTAAIMLGVAVLALVLRLWQRWPWSRVLPEDAFLVLATVCGAGTVTAIGFAVNAGLGQHEHAVSSTQVARTRQSLSAAYAMAFGTEGLGYISLAIMLRNVCVERAFRFATVVLSGLTGIWSIAGIMRFGLGADRTLGAPHKASWIGFAVISLLIQTVQVTLVLWLILPLRLSLGKKLECITWFCCIIPLVFAMTIVRLVYTPEDTFGQDFTFNNTTMVILLLVESNLVLVSAACSGLRGLLNQLSTGFLVADTTTLSSRRASEATWNSRSRKTDKSTESSKNSNIGLSNLGSSNPSAMGATSTTVAHNGSQYAATVQSGNLEPDTHSDEAILVRRTVEVDASASDHLGDR